MIKKHLIVGYGNWGKFVYSYLNSLTHINICVLINKPRKKEKFQITPIEFNKNNKIFNSIHICTPIKNHYKLALKFLKLNKYLIIEKPIVQTLKQINLLISKYKNKLILVNFSDIYNPGYYKLARKFNINNTKLIKITYQKNNAKYKKQYNCLEDWLDHPLSLIFKYFGKPLLFKLIKIEIKKKINFFLKI